MRSLLLLILVILINITFAGRKRPVHQAAKDLLNYDEFKSVLVSSENNYVTIRIMCIMAVLVSLVLCCIIRKCMGCIKNRRNGYSRPQKVIDSDEDFIEEFDIEQEPFRIDDL